MTSLINREKTSNFPISHSRVSIVMTGVHDVLLIAAIDATEVDSTEMTVVVLTAMIEEMTEVVLTETDQIILCHDNSEDRMKKKVADLANSAAPRRDSADKNKYPLAFCF